MLNLAELLRGHFANLHHDLEHGDDRERAVHRARRHVKSMRGVLRLAWPEREDRTGPVGALDRALKALADHLAPARDERVAARTADALARRCDPEVAAWLDALAREAHDKAALGENSRQGRARHKRAIAAIDRQLAGLVWLRAPRDIADALARWHRRARRLLEKALAAHDAEALHEARSAVVRVLVQIEALAEADGGFRKRRKGLDRLRSALGEHHDLALLAQRIEAVPGSDTVRTAALKALAQRQRRLEQQALRLHARWHGPAGRLERKARRHLAEVGSGTP
jgi:hypothetical protein